MFKNGEVAIACYNSLGLIHALGEQVHDEWTDTKGKGMKTNKKGQHIWVMAGGQEIFVHEMDDDHIKNIILLLFKRKFFAHYGQEDLINVHLIKMLDESIEDTVRWIKILNNELESRGSDEVEGVLYDGE